jgi:hypothetical protein
MQMLGSSLTVRGVESARGEVLGFGREIQVDLDRRMFRAEAGNARRQPAGAEGGQRGQRNPRLIEIDGTDETGTQRREGIHGLLGYQLARSRELHSVRMTQEQSNADLFLELPHVIAHRRGGSLQLMRGPGKTAEARRRLEGTDRSKRGKAGVGDHKSALGYRAYLRVVNGACEAG